MNIESITTKTAAAAPGRGEVSPSGRRAAAAKCTGSDSMDTEGKYGCIIAGATPRGAANMIRQRLSGASSDPVTYRQDASGFEFYIGGIPVARLLAGSDDTREWYVDCYNVGRPFAGHAAEFLDKWSPAKYVRACYTFAFHDSSAPNTFRVKAHGNSLKVAPNKHAEFKDDLNDGAQIRAMIQRLFGGDKKRHVVQARFTVKFGSRKNDVPDRMYTTFWVEDKMLYEYRRDVEVKNADGTAREKTTLMQRIEANDENNAGRGMPCVSALARVHARNGKTFFTSAGVGRNEQLRDDLFRILPAQYAQAAPDKHGDGSTFAAERAMYALNAFYGDVLTADDVPVRRVRRAPRSAAVAKTPRDKLAGRALHRVQAQDATAGKKTGRVFAYTEFLEAHGAVSGAEARKLVKGDKQFEWIVSELVEGGETIEPIYQAIYAVFSGYRINPPPFPQPSLGGFVSALQPQEEEEEEECVVFDNSIYQNEQFGAPMPQQQQRQGDDEVIECGPMRIRGAPMLECMLSVSNVPRSEYDAKAEEWEKVHGRYNQLVRTMNKVREARDTHLFDAVDDDDEKVGTGKRDKGYKGSFRIGDAMFVSAQGKLGQLILTSRQIEKAKQSRRTAKENAVKAGKNDLAKAERSEAGNERNGGRSAQRGPAGKDAAPATGDKGRAKAPSPVVKVPVELDVWKRTYGEKYDANKFTEVCMLTERETLEKATWKHVAFFTKNGWDYRTNRKVSVMLHVIKKKEWRTPAQYEEYRKTRTSSKSSRPRGQKRQHGSSNNNSGNSGPRSAGKPKAMNSSKGNRKKMPQTGSIPGLGTP